MVKQLQTPSTPENKHPQLGRGSRVDVPLDVLFARVRQAFLKRGIPASVIAECFHEGGYERSERTLRRHAKNLKDHGYILSPPTGRINTGRFTRKLNNDQAEKLRTWITDSNNSDVPISIHDLRAYTADKLGVEISDSTTRRILQQLEITPKKCSDRSSSKDLSPTQLVEEMLAWKKKMLARKVWFVDPATIFSIDITTTKREVKNRPITTWSPKGSGKMRAKKPKGAWYTNSIVTCVDAMVGDSAPCMLFTHNPAFNLEHQFVTVADRLKRRLKHYGIDPSRIVYKKSTKKYWAEERGMYKTFIRHYIPIILCK